MKYLENNLIYLPLGGSGEIGMNCNLFHFKDSWLMVDLGVTFNDNDSGAYDLILPNIEFLKDKINKLSALILTHAHEDHIGAVPYLYENLGRPPIFCTAFTASVLKRKFDSMGTNNIKINLLKYGNEYDFGPFSIELFSMTHSIPESSSILIKTQNGNIFHTGDWKIDPKPLVGDPIDDSNLKVKLKDKVDIMICDSTNVFEPKPSGSEGEVRDNLRKIFSQHHNGKIVITCFASNIARIESIIKASEESDKCCLLLGRSLRRIYESAQENNLLTNFKNIITEKEAKMLPDENLVIICTGSQGEKRAALSRVVNNNHKFLDLNKKDLLIFSSREIPGNEKRINNVKSIAKKRGCTLLDHTNSKVHVSGHPSKEELGKMYDWVSPDLLIPVHGEYRHLEEQIKFSKESGIKKQILVENGDLVILDRGIDRKIIGKVESGRTVLKGNKLIPLNDKFLSNLDLINSDGEVFINIILDLKDNLMTDPVIFCPSVPIDDNVKSELKLLISKNFDEMCNNSFDDNILCDQIKTNVRSFFKK